MKRLLQELRLALVALQFLTRVPVPGWVGYDPAWLQACLRHFPLVGAVVGGFGAAVMWAASAVWSPTVAAVLGTAATVWLTGAFHEDGLADTCDGLGGAVSRERALAIMKDSRIGTYGAVALVLALGLKVALLAFLLEGAGGAAAGLWAGTALVWGHAASRAAVLCIVWRLPYAGDAEHAKAKPLALQAEGRQGVVAAVWLLALGAGLLALWAPADTGRVALAAGALLAATGAGGLVLLGCMRWLRRRLGGFTGDTLGASQQLVELGCLLAWSAWPAAADFAPGLLPGSAAAL